MNLVTEMLKGSKRALSRLISLIENQSPTLTKWMPKIHKFAKGRAKVIGITGPPGSGKSTMVDQLVRYVRKAKKKVAVLAIDPSSPFTGGALLGDRIRMQRHAKDKGVFIRSLGSRGSFGGLSRATKQIVRILDAFGFDIIFIETVGVGQTELSIMEVAQSSVVILVPESGDTIQTMKAGLLEIADIFIVNKADRPGSNEMKRQLIEMVEIQSAAWKAPVLLTEATNGVGVSDLWDEILSHEKFLKNNKKLLMGRRKQELRVEFFEIAVHEYHKWLTEQSRSKKYYKKLLLDVETERKDPYTAARELLKKGR